MQKVLSLLLVVGISTTVVFAASGELPTGVSSASPSSASTGVPTPPPVSNTPALPQLSAAPVPHPAVSASLGENKSVSCVSNSAFATNSCDACFDGGSITVGKRLTGLFDNWINNTTGLMIAYQGEQKNPNMVAFGATTWTASPADESKIWKSSSDIIWSPTNTGSTKMQYILGAGQKVKFIEAELAA